MPAPNNEKLENLPRTDNQADKQTENSSNTEATLILCGSSGERANKDFIGKYMRK